ncbi:hypothetical protein [Photobacterium damselae]|uniref:hypothetical protein n=1 Tax=Photobacterium damselae TaxID=38293 RepID=UPI0040694C44
MEQIDELLERINKEFMAEGIPHIQRSFLALSKLSIMLNKSIQFGSEESDYVHDWFSKRSKASSLCIGSLFEAAYYYDAEFWSVKIPIVFGTVNLGAFDALSDMPEINKEIIAQDRKQFWQYALFWADCVDFGYGLSDLSSQKSDSFGMQLLNAGFEELQSATSALLSQKPNKRAIMSLRMASEMFMKSYLALKGHLDEKGARKLSHNLDDALKEVVEVSGQRFPNEVFQLVKLFPSIHERYAEQQASNKDIAHCYDFALSLGALVIRETTDRNIQAQVLGNNL